MRLSRFAPAVSSLLMLTLISVVQASSPPVYVVPAGQEELILTMLGKGAELPDGCALGNVTIDVSYILASYGCDAQTVSLKLAHPSAVANPPRRTESFSILPAEGPAAPTLIDAVTAIVRQQESQFQWFQPKAKVAASSERGFGQFVESSPRMSALFGVLASLLLIGVASWTRKRTAKAGSSSAPAPAGDDPAADT